MQDCKLEASGAAPQPASTVFSASQPAPPPHLEWAQDGYLGEEVGHEQRHRHILLENFLGSLCGRKKGRRAVLMKGAN
jgi:hypothetical protein